MQQHKEFLELRNELGLRRGKDLSMENLMDIMGKTEDRKLKIKCFFLILITKFLLPTTSKHVNVHAMMYTKDMAIINDFDWCAVVYENFRSAILDWEEKMIALEKLPPEKKKRTIHGCTIMLLVSIYLLLFFIVLFC